MTVIDPMGETSRLFVQKLMEWLLTIQCLEVGVGTEWTQVAQDLVVCRSNLDGSFQVEET